MGKRRTGVAERVFWPLVVYVMIDGAETVVRGHADSKPWLVALGCFFMVSVVFVASIQAWSKGERI